MKKILFTAFAVIALALTSFAGPHTKEYQDTKKILNEYEQNVNKATTCEDLENASMAFLFNLLSLIEVEYDENEAITEQEEQELTEQMDRIDKKVTSLQQQWGCESEEEETASDYMQVMSALNQLEMAISNARNCEELNTAVEVFLEQSEGIDGSTFTDEEAKAFEEKSTIVGEKLSKKADILCK